MQSVKRVLYTQANKLIIRYSRKTSNVISVICRSSKVNKWGTRFGERGIQPRVYVVDRGFVKYRSMSENYRRGREIITNRQNDEGITRETARDKSRRRQFTAMTTRAHHRARQEVINDARMCTVVVISFSGELTAPRRVPARANGGPCPRNCGRN